MQDLGYELPRRPQHVEKVVIGSVGGPREPEKQGQKATKTAFSASEPGAEESAKEFFKTLTSSRQ
jgi:hypothetical protein